MSEDEQQVVNIKQRIVGALVLVSIGVILIPMLLNGGLLKGSLQTNNNDSEQAISGDNIPPMPKELNKVLPKVPEPMLMPAAKKIAAYPERDTIVKKTAKEAITTKSDNTRLKETSPSGKNVTAVKPVSTPRYKKADKPKDKAITSAFALQIASFSVKKNADNLKLKLRKKGHKAYIEVVKMDTGKIYRLRAGPYLKFNEISAVKKTIEKQFKQKKMVIVKY